MPCLVMSFVHLLVGVRSLLIFISVWIWEDNRSLPVIFGLIIPSSLWFTEYFEIESRSWVHKYVISCCIFSKRCSEGGAGGMEWGKGERRILRQGILDSKKRQTIWLFCLNRLHGLFNVKSGNVSTTFQALWSWKGQAAPVCNEKQILLIHTEK